jgi:N-acetylmuramoyl-L-alanine amidase
MRAWWISLWLLGAGAAAPLAAESPRWVTLGNHPYLKLEDWAAAARFTSFIDQKSGRILLERKNLPPVILLIDSPYALVGGKFLALPDFPLRRNGAVLFSADSAERVFPGLLPEAERDAFVKLAKGAQAEVPATPTAPMSKAPPALPPKARPVELPVVSSCLVDRPVKKIFLDPGHGGEDAGTKANGIYEKNITLAFARQTADELRRRGFEVSFSRTRDVFLPLEVRTKLAEKWKADLFISLHVNSSPHHQAHGTETYILSQDATDAEARKLALIENSIASSGKDRQSAVQDILWDMEQTAYLQDSAYLASYLQGALIANAHAVLKKEKIEGDWKNRGVRQAPFYVLNRAAMPAVLVELGYLSNPGDRKLLLTKSFQESLSKALADGVKKYRDECRKE